jgi:hypothetical protein
LTKKKFNNLKVKGNKNDVPLINMKAWKYRQLKKFTFLRKQVKPDTLRSPKQDIYGTGLLVKHQVNEKERATDLRGPKKNLYVWSFDRQLTGQQHN